MFDVPYPSITICPNNRVDWEEAIKIINKLIPANNEEAKNILKQALQSMSELKFSHLHELDFHANDTALEILDREYDT